MNDDFKTFNIKGGILAWIHEGLYIVDNKGKTQKVHVYGSKWNLVPDGYKGVWI